jgi:hypothetical protein
VDETGMKIPILNIYIITEKTFKRIVEMAAMKAYKFSSKQISLLIKDNDRLAQGLPTKRKMRFKKNGKRKHINN